MRSDKVYHWRLSIKPFQFGKILPKFCFGSFMFVKVKIGKNLSNPTFGEIDTCDISKVLDLQKSIIGEAYTFKVYM